MQSVVGLLAPGLCLSVTPNQNRASSIGRTYTVNGTGALTGVSRVLFSMGESIGPIVCINLLYPLGGNDPSGAPASATTPRRRWE